MNTLILSRKDAALLVTLLKRGSGDVVIRPFDGVGYELGAVRILARELVEAHSTNG